MLVRCFGGISAERLRQLVDRFPSRPVAVLGDFFLDKYLDVEPSLAETSVETGRTAHQVVGVRHGPGAAGTVAANLAALGAEFLLTPAERGTDGAIEKVYELIAEQPDRCCLYARGTGWHRCHRTQVRCLADCRRDIP